MADQRILNWSTCSAIIGLILLKRLAILFRFQLLSELFDHALQLFIELSFLGLFQLQLLDAFLIFVQVSLKCLDVGPQVLNVELQLSAIVIPLVILVRVARPQALSWSLLLTLGLVGFLSLDFLVHLISRERYRLLSTILLHMLQSTQIQCWYLHLILLVL